MDERTQSGIERVVKIVPDAVWAPAAAALLTAVVGAFSIIVGHPSILPAVGGTIFLQSWRPAHRSARLYNVLAGHGIGLLAGIIGVVLSGALGAEEAVVERVAVRPEEVGAAIIAMPLVLAAQRLTRAVHPPGVVTALLMAMGGFTVSLIGVAVVVAGVVLTAAAGEALRRVRLHAATRPT